MLLYYIPQASSQSDSCYAEWLNVDGGRVQNINCVFFFLLVYCYSELWIGNRRSIIVLLFFFCFLLVIKMFTDACSRASSSKISFSFLVISSFLFFAIILLLFRYSFPTFSPIAHPYPISLPPRVNFPQPPHRPCPWVLCSCFLAWPFPFFSRDPPQPSPLVTVSLFFIPKSLVLFCSFVLLIRFNLWGHMVFIFHSLAYFT